MDGRIEEIIEKAKAINKLQAEAEYIKQVCDAIDHGAQLAVIMPGYAPMIVPLTEYQSDIAVRNVIKQFLDFRVVGIYSEVFGPDVLAIDREIAHDMAMAEQSEEAPEAVATEPAASDEPTEPTAEEVKEDAVDASEAANTDDWQDVELPQDDTDPAVIPEAVKKCKRPDITLDYDMIRSELSAGKVPKQIMNKHYPELDDIHYRWFTGCLQDHGIDWDKTKARVYGQQKLTDSGYKRKGRPKGIASGKHITQKKASKTKQPYWGDLAYECEVCGKHYDYSTFNKHLNGDKRGSKLHRFCSWSCLRSVETKREG